MSLCSASEAVSFVFGVLTGGRQVGAGVAVQDVVFFFLRATDAQVDDGPVGAGFVVFGGPGC